MQTETAVATVLPDADMAGLMPAPLATAPAGSEHSRVLTVEQITRARSSPHLEMVRSILRGSQERSQSGETSSIAQPTLRPSDGGHEGNGESSR